MARKCIYILSRDILRRLTILIEPSIEQIDFVVGFWVELIKKPKNPRKIGSIELFPVPPASDQSIEVFQVELAKRIPQINRSGYEIITSVGYDPCAALKGSLIKAGLVWGLYDPFPPKTGCVIDLLAGFVFSYVEGGRPIVLNKTDLEYQQGLWAALVTEDLPETKYSPFISREEGINNVKNNVLKARQNFERFL
jgi:hypothetical protein